jgi:PiT family inorganic phosphate transporter
MEISVLVYLTSGLFLGWALGANHLGNVFGTAVGTRMIRFTTAATLCSIFVVLGAVISGGGAAETVGKLGAVNTLSGSFMAAFAAAVAVYIMTRFGLPVSTTHAIVGAIIGWSFYSESRTDFNSLTKIMIGWVLGPVLAAIFAVVLLYATGRALHYMKLHLLRQDAYNRVGLILAGSFGAYSLGANNIANVVGVFIPAAPFTEFQFLGLITISPAQQLFLLGGLAIVAGIFTYSGRVVHTVGKGLFTLSPVAAWVVVMAHSIVLFLFASEGLESFLAAHGLPTIPLVPISSSEVVVGAVIGVALVKGAHNFRFGTLGRIGVGWMLTPAIACLVCYVGLFFMQNVFNQRVYQPVHYVVSADGAAKAESTGVPAAVLKDLIGRKFGSAYAFKDALMVRDGLTRDQIDMLLGLSELEPIAVRPEALGLGRPEWLSPSQMAAVEALGGRIFPYRWELMQALAERSPEWRLRENAVINKKYNQAIRYRIELLYRAHEDGRK